jgi:hypothetical protein
VKIETGQPESHPTPLAYDPAATPGVQRPTQAFPGNELGEQGGVAPTTGMFAEQAAAGTADCSAAMSSGMSADGARRDHYAGTLATGSYGDQPVIPDVPAAALPPASSSGYPYAGMEPTPAAAGFEDPAYGT